MAAHLHQATIETERGQNVKGCVGLYVNWCMEGQDTHAELQCEFVQ